MAKKRKSDASRLDEVERSMYSTFCSAANSLSQIYTQAMNQQKVSFQAGERHSLEKLYQWILRQHEEASRVTAADIVAYLQHEIEFGGEEVSMSPRYQAPPQHPPQSTVHSTNTIIQTDQTSSVSFGQATAGHGSRAGQADQTKNSVFSNALSSPIRRTLQSYHLPQGGECYPDGVLHAGNGSRNPESNQNKDPNSNDSSMDMHSDSPAHDSY